jgi:hypothetical protein
VELQAATGNALTSESENGMSSEHWAEPLKEGKTGTAWLPQAGKEERAEDRNRHKTALLG